MDHAIEQDLWILLRTAAAMLLGGVLGIAAGLGNFMLALGASLLCVIVLAMFRRIEAKMGTSGP